MNIIQKLNRGSWVGPCTAIGQDYQLLEKDGVITTMPAGQGMYNMKIRQKEVGLLVEQLLEFSKIVPEVDAKLQALLAKQPSSYTIPEDRRSRIMTKETRMTAKIQEKLMQTIRTMIQD